MAELALAGRVELSCLAREAAAGDESAWNELVRRLDGVLRGVARRYRLAAADVDDVVQTTWLRAVDHVGRLDDPGRSPVGRGYDAPRGHAHPAARRARGPHR